MPRLDRVISTGGSARLAVIRFVCETAIKIQLGDVIVLKRALNQYRGRLTPAQIAAGISAAQENANRLMDDAKFLLASGRLPSAAALAILSIEERGKAIVLKRLALLSEAADLKEAWREYRSHRAKNAGWIIPQLIKGGVRTMHGMAAAVDNEAEHAFLLDNLKQISLYTECLGDANWSIPRNIIDEALVRGLVSSAEMMWGSNSVTTREIELWVEIVGPYYNKAGMIEAVINWQRAMVAEGLSDNSPDELGAFMRSKPIEVVNEPSAED